MCAHFVVGLVLPRDVEVRNGANASSMQRKRQQGAVSMGQGSKARFFRLAAALILGTIVSSIGLTGCGGFFTAIGTGGNGGTGTSSYVYVTNFGGTLAEYSLTSGVLAPLSGSPITLPLAPYSIVVAPNDVFVYIGTGTGVFLYTISSDGTLTEGNGDNVAYVNAGNSSLIAQSMVIDSTSSWLLIAYRNSVVLDAVQLTPSTGLPTGAVFSINSSFDTPSPELAISPANTQVYVALGTGGTEALGFTPSGTSAPLGPWPSTGTKIGPAVANASANGVAVDPTSKYLLIAEANTNTAGDAIAGTVRIESTAALGTDLDAEATGIGPSAVLSDLTGAYVYVTNGTDGTISGFTLDATTQKLTSLGTAFPTEKSPVALVEDRSKTYIMDVGNLANPNLWLYSFDASSAGSLDVSATKSTGTTNPSAANGIAATH
jgi:6-phosphogluconolactonase